MFAPLDIFRPLREAQVRAAQEQQLFSGRDWLRVATIVQFLSALYPVYLWISLEWPGHRNTSEPVINLLRISALCLFGLGLVFLLLSWWANYAPFRAAVIGLALFLACNVLVAVTLPHHFIDGAASRLLVLLGLLMAVRTGYRRRRPA